MEGDGTMTGEAAPVTVQPARPGVPAGRFAVVDIGSNSIRLVVYDAPTRLPIPMYNEKAQSKPKTKTKRA